MTEGSHPIGLYKKGGGGEDLKEILNETDLDEGDIKFINAEEEEELLSPILKRLQSVDKKQQVIREDLHNLDHSFEDLIKYDELPPDGIRYFLDKSGMGDVCSDHLEIITSKQELQMMLGEYIEFVIGVFSKLHDLEEDDYGDIVDEMDIELIYGGLQLAIPNYDSYGTWEIILRLRSRSVRLSDELITKYKSIMKQLGAGNPPVSFHLLVAQESQTFENIVRMEIERMVVDEIEKRKSKKYYESELGIRHLLSDPELIYLALSTGYVILDSSRIFFEKRPDKAAKEIGKKRLPDIQDRISSGGEEVIELNNSEDISETIQTSFDDWD